MGSLEEPRVTFPQDIVFFDPTLTVSEVEGEYATRYSSVGREIDAFCNLAESITVCSQFRPQNTESDPTLYHIQSIDDFIPLPYWSSNGDRTGFMKNSHQFVPLIWSTIRELSTQHDIVWLRSGPHPATIVAYFAAKSLDVNVVYFVGADFKQNTKNRVEDSPVSKKIIHRGFAEVIDRFTHWISTQSDCMLVHPGHLEQKYSGAKNLKTTLVSTITEDDIINKPEWSPGSTVSILYVGRLTNDKGVDVLIDALADVDADMDTDVELVIRGTGGDKKYIEKQIKQHELEGSVQFVPFLPFNELLKLYRDSDIFVLPSRMEGQGRVLIEAMASGCVVIATNTGGIPQIISDGKNGLLTDVGSSVDLADNIKKAIRNEDKATQLIDNATEWAANHTVEKETEKSISAVLNV